MDKQEIVVRILVGMLSNNATTGIQKRELVKLAVQFADMVILSTETETKEPPK